MRKERKKYDMSFDLVMQCVINKKNIIFIEKFGLSKLELYETKESYYFIFSLKLKYDFIGIYLLKTSLNKNLIVGLLVN